jgi:hypothetical protein
LDEFYYNESKNLEILSLINVSMDEKNLYKFSNLRTLRLSNYKNFENVKWKNFKSLEKLYITSNKKVINSNLFDKKVSILINRNVEFKKLLDHNISYQKNEIIDLIKTFGKNK